MAFPEKKSGMPPPKKADLTVVVGADSPKSGASPKPAEEPGDDKAPGGAKVSTEDAIVIRAGDKICDTCENYSPESGECAEVEGVFDPDDRCLRYYEAKGTDEEAGKPPMSGMPPEMPMGMPGR